MSEDRLGQLLETRLRRPQEIAGSARARGRPAAIADLGPLVIVAVDHLARGALGAGFRRSASCRLRSPQRSWRRRKPCGVTSAHTWLKVPVVQNMAAVFAETTLPTLRLVEELREDRGALLALPNVSGMVLGRSQLNPAADDVLRAVDTLVRLLPTAPMVP